MAINDKSGGTNYTATDKDDAFKFNTKNSGFDRISSFDPSPDTIRLTNKDDLALNISPVYALDENSPNSSILAVMRSSRFSFLRATASLLRSRIVPLWMLCCLGQILEHWHAHRRVILEANALE
jgi:hypothetical protein